MLDSVVFVDESAEPGMALDLAGVSWIGGDRWVGRVQRESSVRSLVVVVGRVDAEDPYEVAAAEDQQPVETLGADSAHETLGVGVCLWRPDRRLDDLDAFAAEDLVEGGGELAVAVVD
jgi:hypothetical protein